MGLPDFFELDMERPPIYFLTKCTYSGAAMNDKYKVGIEVDTPKWFTEGELSKITYRVKNMGDSPLPNLVAS